MWEDVGGCGRMWEDVRGCERTARNDQDAYHSCKIHEHGYGTDQPRNMTKENRDSNPPPKVSGSAKGRNSVQRLVMRLGPRDRNINID